MSLRNKTKGWKKKLAKFEELVFMKLGWEKRIYDCYTKESGQIKRTIRGNKFRISLMQTHA